MHELIEVPAVEQVLGRAKRFEGNHLVTDVGPFAQAILKFKSISVCEVLGYELAARIGVRIARMQGFWTQTVVNAAEITAEPGRVGILVDYHEDWIHLGDADAA